MDNYYLRTIMKEFLRIVAEHLVSTMFQTNKTSEEGTILPSTSCLNMVDYLLVFPNRRSGLFFSQYLSEQFKHPILSPHMMTTGELFVALADVKLADRLSLLFRLYKNFIAVSQSDKLDRPEEFDNFVFWGDMLLADFDDLDKYEVDARDLFHNIRDLKEIEMYYADYDQETIAIIRSFWKNYSPNQKDHKKQVFDKTWNILYDLYLRFREDLRDNGEAYEGMLQRSVVEKIKTGVISEEYIKSRLPYKKIFFVGLTAISGVDRSLMKYLDKIGMAGFYWDYADVRLKNLPSSAAFFTEDNLKDFPNLLDERVLSDSIVQDEDKEIEIIAVPSGVGQTIQTGKLLEKWVEDGYISPESKSKTEKNNPIRSAIILPDEKLLIPMLYNVPEKLEPFNVTMGYGLKDTSVAGFVSLLIRLQMGIRKTESGEISFYYRSLQALLAHPFLSLLSQNNVEVLNETIIKNSLFRVNISVCRDYSDSFLDLVFIPVFDVYLMADYLLNILNYLLNHPDNVLHTIQREFLLVYINVLERINNLMHQYQYAYKLETFVHLLQRLVQGEKVPFSGEPLEGLQVMGVLETRSLDFDNLIMLSMNEGVFPAKTMSNTFIPMSLRRAFSMPTHKHRDAIYACHFYRLLSRAKRVKFLYDTRSEGMQYGEMSRYLLQMKHLYQFKMPLKPINYAIKLEDNLPFQIKKDSSVMQLLDAYKSGGTRQFSATALKVYVSCPIRFYLQYVQRLKEEEEVKEEIDSGDVGTIFHDSLQCIYETYFKGKRVDAGFINKLLKERDEIREVVKNKYMGIKKLVSLDGYNLIVYEVICEYVYKVLEHDKDITPFIYLCSEFEHVFDFQVDPSLSVRIKSIYDRIDIDKNGRLRIVDYKTSHPGDIKNGIVSKCIFNSIEGFFSANNKSCSEEAFQVMMYCMLLKLLPQEEFYKLFPQENTLLKWNSVSPHLYFVRDFYRLSSPTSLFYRPKGEMGEENKFEISEGEVFDYALFDEQFEYCFRAIITEIFNPNIPFKQTESEEGCKYCPFISICKRSH